MTDLETAPTGTTAPEIEVEVDPADVGLDPDRLARIERRFQSYVDDGRLPGFLTVLARQGKVAHIATGGHRDVEAGLPVTQDTLWRIYSMTKPITAAVAMTLWEEGAFELNDPVHRYIPAFRDCRVWKGGTALNPQTEPTMEPVRMWHLFTHTSGLTYGFHHSHPVDTLYREAGFEWGNPPGLDLEGVCDLYASLPLVFQPGSEWNYSVSLDVLGRVIEVLTGMTLDRAFEERLFKPLGMTRTAFQAPEDDLDRLAALYTPAPKTRLARRSDQMGNAITMKPRVLNGGGGLCSTAHDYQRFASMLLNGGELDGVRILGPRTVKMMGSNWLPRNVDLETFPGRPLFAETTFSGVGFGLGMSVMTDPVATHTGGSVGEFSWGGAASTVFWVDPAEQMTAMFFTQLLPSSTYPLRSQFHQMVHQAIIDG
jgi:CubicO group peptidase (beta-lactamase class C family)